VRLRGVRHGSWRVRCIWLRPSNTAARPPAIAERMTTNAALGARLSFIRNDLADPGDLPRFVDAIFTAFGHIECLVNNAAYLHKATCSTSPPRADLDFAVNARGAFFLPKPSARRCSRPRPTFPKARVRSCSYPPPMLSSQPRSAGGVCDFQSNGRPAG